MAPAATGRASPGALYAGGLPFAAAQKAPKSSRGSCGSGSDPDAPPKEIRTSEQSEDFMINVYKLKLCPRSPSHDWRTCPYAHQGENAARRDHQKTQYLSVCCPESKAKRLCPRGNDCPFAHSMTEYRTQMCNDGAKCTRPICFFAHSAAELRTPAYPSLNPAQLEALFSARASLAREDEAALEQTLRACVIGQLPPLPNTVAPAPGRGGKGSPVGAPPAAGPGSAHCSGSHALRAAAAGGAAGGASGPLPDLRCVSAGLALDAAALGGGLPYGGGVNGGACAPGLGQAGGLTYHPYIHAAGPACDDGAFAGAALYGGGGGGGGSGSSNSGCWGAASGPGAQAVPTASQPFATADYGVPFWLQQQQQQPAPAPVAPPQHRQSLANLAQIQMLRDQLRAAEEAELASIAQAEAAFNSQAAAAAAAAVQGLSLGRAGSGDAAAAALLGCAGAGGGAGLDGNGFCSIQQLVPDLLASAQQQYASAAGAAAAFGLADPAAAGRAGAGGGAGDPSGAGGASGASGGLHLLPAFWGSGAIQSDGLFLMPGGGASASAPLASLHQQQQHQQMAVWPPPAFGGPQLGPPQPALPGLRTTGSLDGGCGSGWSFTSVPAAGASSGPGCGGGPSLPSGAGTGSTPGVGSLLSSAPGSSGGVSGAGSVYTAASLSNAGSVASAGGAPFPPPSQPLPGAGTPSVQPSTPQHAPAACPAASAGASPARAPVSSLAAAIDADPFVPASSAADRSQQSRSAPLSSLSPLLHGAKSAPAPAHRLGQAAAAAAAAAGPQAPVVPVAPIGAEGGGMRLMLLDDA
ncbi:hypothetical protein Rsub_08873 [Raphidocelis subcapitata]|uniref:C3H1-type domain-containing protein n=1 Tax=Raphidocelis subcapitata TaxID=307507 RepID=A0A2V0PGD1_9CHLO|nr:hypothetical protein Rsub_08873 [Raphidocelis subcapitata]|eukprot:GBF96125.1 hypothetical protein Rsub_08873 [Raphidocelis subcapitata]